MRRLAGFVFLLTIACLIMWQLASAAQRTIPSAAAPIPEVMPASAVEPYIGIDTQATNAYIEEVETGQVLLDKAANQRLYPASMNKMMTAYVVFTMLKEGRAKLDQKLLVSRRAWALGGSKMFVPLGKEVSVNKLLQGMIVDSGNDACIVLAQGLAGSEAGFVALMNREAKKIGLTGSHFDDVTGLPDPNDWTTARDLAALAIRTIEDFPQYYHYYGQPSFTFGRITQRNRNPLLFANIGADGLKTGYTKEAGYGLTASVKRGNRRIVMVVTGLPTKLARGEESERLIDWAFRTFADYKLFSAGQYVDTADVWLGAEDHVTLTVARDLVVTLPKKARQEMKVTIDYENPIPAPIERGEKVGTITITAPGVSPLAAPLVAKSSVAPLGHLARIPRLAGYLIRSWR